MPISLAVFLVDQYGLLNRIKYVELMIHSVAKHTYVHVVLFSDIFIVSLALTLRVVCNRADDGLLAAHLKVIVAHGVLVSECGRFAHLLDEQALLLLAHHVQLAVAHGRGDPDGGLDEAVDVAYVGGDVAEDGEYVRGVLGAENAPLVELEEREGDLEDARRALVEHNVPDAQQQAHVEHVGEHGDEPVDAYERQVDVVAHPELVVDLGQVGGDQLVEHAYVGLDAEQRVRVERGGQDVLDDRAHHPEGVLFLEQQEQVSHYGAHALAVANVRIDHGERAQYATEARHAHALLRAEAHVLGQRAQQVVLDLLVLQRVRHSRLMLELAHNVGVGDVGLGPLAPRARQAHPNELAQRVRHALALDHRLKLLAPGERGHLVPRELQAHVGVERELQVGDPLELVLTVLDEWRRRRRVRARHYLEAELVIDVLGSVVVDVVIVISCCCGLLLVALGWQH